MANKKCQLTQAEYYLSKAEQKYFIVRNLDLPSFCEIERLRSILALVPQPKFSTGGSSSLSCTVSRSGFAVNNVPKAFSGDIPLDNFKSFISYFSNFVARQSLANSICDYENPLLFGSASLENCLDCNFCLECKECYDCISCYQCERVCFSRLSNFCRDSKFLDNCFNCSNCLFCTNLVDCEYFVFNKQVTKSEFLEVQAAISLIRNGNLDYEKERFESFLLNQPLINSKNDSGFLRGYPLSTNSDYETTFNSRECKNSSSLNYCSGVSEGFACSAVWGSFKEITNSALLYGAGKKINRSIACIGQTENVDSSVECENSSNIFGCIGLKNASYCIFNQQYRKPDFIEAFQKIKFLLKDQGASSNLLLSQFKIIPYNVSLAGIMFPLNNVQSELFGYSWDHSQERVVIPEASDNESICEIIGVPFVIGTGEKEFLDSIGVAYPNRSPLQRFKDRLNKVRIGNSHTEICTMSNDNIISWDKDGRVSLSNLHNK